MRLLLQFGIIFGTYWVSQCIESVLPFPFPASVISLLLILLLLIFRIVKLDQIKEKADFLLGNLAFFFVPAVTGLIEYVDVLKESLVAFLVICIVSTILTFAATATAVQFTVRWMNQRKGEKK